MSTNAIIKIEGYKTAMLYKHYDGNPNSTLKWLKDFNEDFEKFRGNDLEYKFAQLIRSSAFDFEKYGLDGSRYTGWGVIEYSSKNYYDYTYKLMHDGSVEYLYSGGRNEYN